VRGRGVTRAGREVALKPKEFDVLFFLAKNAGPELTREQHRERLGMSSSAAAGPSMCTCAGCAKSSRPSPRARGIF
jgi:hypothetical protein